MCLNKLSDNFFHFQTFQTLEKLAKRTSFATGHCFIHPPIIFTPQSLIVPLQHIKPCIGLLSQSL